MSPVLWTLAVLLIVMAVPPVIAALVLWRFRHSPSLSLRERSQLALLLAALALVSAFLALNRLLNLGISGEWAGIAFALILVLIDMSSGRWLWEFLAGDFVERPEHIETPLEREDREVGDTRRQLQAEAANDANEAPEAP